MHQLSKNTLFWFERILVANTLFEIDEGNKVVTRTSDVLDEVVESVTGIAEQSRLLSEMAIEQAESMEQANAISMNELVSKFRLRD